MADLSTQIYAGAGRAAAATDRPVLVHMSPLPETRNGIADYAATILLRLCQDYECIAVVERPETVSQAIRAVCHVISYSEYALIFESLKNERHLAHIGNNGDHIPILNALSLVPGVVVLHDLTLHYLLEIWAVDSFGGIDAHHSAMLALHGAFGAAMIEAKHHHKWPVQAVYNELNGLPVLSDLATAIITHSHYGQVLALAAGYSAPTRVIPHFAEIPAPDLKARRRADFRRQHRLADDTIVFSSLGFVTPNKIIKEVLIALSKLPAGMGDWCYVIGGQNRDPEVQDLIQRIQLQGRLIVLDYLAEEDFDTVLAASDVVINLRIPTSGETSGTVCRAIANGVPCIVNNHGWYAELPEAATWKVDPVLETCLQELPVFLLRVLLDPKERQDKALAALAYARETLDLDTVVHAYRDVIEQAHKLGPRDDSQARQHALPLIFPPTRTFSTLETPPEILVARLLEGEFVSRNNGSETRRIVLPTAGQGIGWVANAGGEGATTQAFASIEMEQGVGGALLVAADAAATLQVGDLFTLLAMYRAPNEPTHMVVPSLASGPLLLPPTPQAQLADILRLAGFHALRSSTTPILGKSNEQGDCEAIVITAKKVSPIEVTLSGLIAKS